MNYKNHSESAPAIRLVDHVALRVLAFVPFIPIDLHELLENGTITPCAFRGKNEWSSGNDNRIVIYL